MPYMNLSYSEGVRAGVTAAQARSIRKMYEGLAKKIAKQIEEIKLLNTATAALKRKQLKDLQNSLKKEIEKLGKQLEKEIVNDASKVASAVAKDAAGFIGRAGLHIKGAYGFVPTDIVRAIKAGKVYNRKWFLSEAIWGDVKKKQGDIDKIVAKGIAENKPVYDIAKDLEKYVDPKAAKDWAWSKVYPGTSKRIDYNAQRLARTLTAHAYQQSLVMATKDNPFVQEIEWRSAQIHGRTCKLCMERHGKRYKPKDLPPDHPNGLCTYMAVTPNLEEVGSRIGKWLNGASDPDLDRYAAIIARAA